MMMLKGLRTERLRFEKYKKRDWVDFNRLVSSCGKLSKKNVDDEELYTYFEWMLPYDGARHSWKIVRIEDREFIGDIQVSNFKTYTELGFCLFEEYRGKGYMKEALLYLVQVLKYMKKNIEINVKTDNIEAVALVDKLELNKEEIDGIAKYTWRIG